MRNLNFAKTKFAAIAGVALAALIGGTAVAGEIYPDGAFSDYSANLENGKTLFHASACASCHGLADQLDTLAGGLKISTKLGTFYTPNITPNKEHGIGNWSNARFLNAVLNGTKDDGSKYFGSIFPYAAFSKMSPEEALDIKAYISTLPESDAPSKEHSVSFPSKLIMRQWSDERPQLMGSNDPQIARGEFLVNSAAHCSECHTPRNMGAMTYKLDEENPFAGETGLFGDFAPKINAKHLEAFGAEAFVVGNMLEAKKLNGKPLTLTNKRRYAKEYAKLPLEDRTAIYAYLTGKPVDPSGLKAMDTSAMEKMNGGKIVEVAEKEEVKDTRPDTTGATELMQRIDAYCTVPTQVTAKAGGNKSSISPAIIAEADSIMDGYCRDCHGPGRGNAGSFPMGDIASIAGDRNSVIPGNPEGSPLFASIVSNRMPLGKKMTKDEVAALHTWITALGADANAQTAAPAVEIKSAPKEALPKFIGGTIEELHLAAMNDLRQLDQLDWQYTRYFNFAYTPLPPVDCSAEGLSRNPVYTLHAAFNKFINSASLGNRLVPVTAVPGTNGALVRIDLRDYEWTAEQWLSISTGAFTESVAHADFTQKAWDTLLRTTSSIYPYAISPSSDPILAALAQGVGDDVPIMRADWFTRFASESPYYDVLLQLPDDIAVLERRLNVDVAANIFSQRIIRAGFDQGQSGVSDHNRMLERHELANGGYYWKSYDFETSDGEGSLLAHPDGPPELGRTASGTKPFEYDGGEMIFSLPNGLQGYYLSDNLGNRLLIGPTAIVSNRKKANGRGVEIINARSCFECHDNGIVFNTDVVRKGILSSAQFNKDQRDILLRMYPEEEVIQEAYMKDFQFFVDNLAKLNITETNSAGMTVSSRPPFETGQTELVTYLADLHFDDLEYDALAREFGLTVEEFQDRIFGIGDAHLSQIVATWTRRAQNGLKIPREEVENYWKVLLPLLTHLDAYTYAGGVTYEAVKTVEDYEKVTEVAVQKATEKLADPYKPTATVAKEYEEFKKPSNPMHLLIRAGDTDVKVGDYLEFEISTNRDCELQILYVEANKTIEEYPQSVLGPNILEANEWRKVPFPGSKLRVQFDEPGNGETLIAFCRVGGLGEHRIRPHEVVELAKELSLDRKRGISFVAEEQIEVDEGESAYNYITFDVR